MACNTKNVKNSIKLDVFIMNQSLQYLYFPITSSEFYIKLVDEKNISMTVEPWIK